MLKVSKGVASWKKYVDYFSDVIVDGLSTTIIATVRYLLNQLDPEVLARTEGAPLMEIQLELVASEIVWKPELTEGKVATSVRDMVGKWLRSFVEIGRLLKRLDIGEGDYMKELEEDYDVADSINQVTVISLGNEQRCEAFKGQFQKFDYLWTKDLQVGRRNPLARDTLIPHLFHLALPPLHTVTPHLLHPTEILKHVSSPSPLPLSTPLLPSPSGVSARVH